LTVQLGLLGGTFNPPHHGHLVMAQEALDQLGLDEVWLVPVAVPPHKALPDDPGGEVRARLCELAVGDDPRLAVSRMELGREGPSFTVDTLRALHADRPEAELTFIVGADNAHGLPSWREPEAVLGLARLAVAERDGVRREDLSSTVLRRRVAEGRPIRFYVPDAVAEEIARRGLYASQPTTPGRPNA
jgi:nicotinate-nucleotide adenylyltransferase